MDTHWLEYWQENWVILASPIYKELILDTFCTQVLYNKFIFIIHGLFFEDKKHFKVVSILILQQNKSLQKWFSFNLLVCIEFSWPRHYTVRYREKNRKWNYQTCPTKDTVIDNLKPNTVYEFGVQPSSKDGTGVWSKPVIHNVSTTAIDGRFDTILVLRFVSLYFSFGSTFGC